MVTENDTPRNRDIEGTMWKIKNIATLLTQLDLKQEIDLNVVCTVGQTIEDLALKAIDDYVSEGTS